MLHALILAGGSGTRFWPLSRASVPKHLISLDGGPSLLEQTFARFAEGGAVRPEHIWVATQPAQAAAVRERLPQLPPQNLLVEPEGRDTAAAIGLGAAAIVRASASASGGAAAARDAVLCVAPADHAIRPARRFREAVTAAASLILSDRARRDAIVTLAVPPNAPSTAFGYIRRGEEVRDARVPFRAFRVAEFKEKPDAATAERYIAAASEYFWNAGIFIWRAEAVLAALDRFLPETAAVCRLEGEELDAAWRPLPKISVDYAVLEKAASLGHVLALEADFEWNDVGSWRALPELYGADADGTTVVGAAHRPLDSRRLTVVAPGGHLVATVGVEDLVVVATGDATLICRRDRVEDVKKLVQALEREGRSEVR